jgi:hypothetical protein
MPPVLRSLWKTQQLHHGDMHDHHLALSQGGRWFIALQGADMLVEAQTDLQVSAF